jgi:predicted dehydrogenase
MPHRDPHHYLFNKDVSGGGFFNWLLVHWIDLLFFFLKDEVTSVTAIVDTDGPVPVDVEVGGTAVLKFARGALANLHGGYYLPKGKESAFNLYGSAGWMHWSPQGDPELHVFTTAPRWQIAPERRIRYRLLKEEGYGGLYGIAMLRDWIEAIREDRPPVNSINDAFRVLQVVDAIYEASSSGRQRTVII